VCRHRRVYHRGVGLLVLVFLVVPIVELYVIIQVGGELGALNTIGLLVLISVVGAWLVKRAGIGVLRRLQQQLGSGHMPTNELIDGFLIMFAGALLLTPGFLTDVTAILLLLAPVRAGVRSMLKRRFARRLGGPRKSDIGVIDVEEL
jgi:UPF0716 protein FxsA